MKAKCFKLKDTKVEFPEVFGDVENADYCLDIHPLKEKFKGTDCLVVASTLAENRFAIINLIVNSMR